MTTEFVLPSNPKDREAIKNAVNELCDSMTRIDSERDLQKSIVDDVNENTGLDKSILKQLASWKHKGTKDKAVQKVNDVEFAYDQLFN